MLVVGSGQSGGQIAEDLVHAGRRVFLATSRTGRLVRRYRGGDSFNWLTISGFADVPRRELILENGRLPPRPLLGATHTISLQSLSAQGVVLLGRCRGVVNGSLAFGDEVIGAVPGLYFAGLDFASTRKSGTIPAVAEEAAHMVDHIAKR